MELEDLEEYPEFKGGPLDGQRIPKIVFKSLLNGCDVLVASEKFKGVFLYKWKDVDLVYVKEVTQELRKQD